MPNIERLINAYATIVDELDDATRPGVVDTPQRAAKAMAFSH